MNLRGLANSLTRRISPNEPIVWKQFIKTYRDVLGNTTPQYRDVAITGNIQPLASDDLQHLDNINQQGTFMAVYTNSAIEGMRRGEQKAQDMLVFRGQTWMVVQVLEDWRQDGWSKIIVKRQEVADVYEPPQRPRGPAQIRGL
ncbi:phage collar protein [Entomobacter blattae]|uniref:phage collar protein n=1 Tax=Entomobacter blattae TaxID=2762277 RepID=UPI00193B286A|nr:hypothetical protein [Entomobacter blattae]